MNKVYSFFVIPMKRTLLTTGAIALSLSFLVTTASHAKTPPSSPSPTPSPTPAPVAIKAGRLLDVKTGKIQRGRKKKGAHTRPAVSQPGAPPYSHLGTLKNLIFFAYDSAGGGSVVVGPVPFGGKAVAPKALEYGGPSSKRERHKLRRTLVRARPYMAPALAKVLPQFAPLFKG